MRARISDDLVNEELSNSQIDNAIRSSIAFYEAQRFWFNETVSTFTTVAAQEYYTSSDLADIPYIVQFVNALVTNNGVKYEIIPVDFDAIDDMQTGALTTVPTHYAYYKSQIRLYPIPDAAYTVTLAYIKKASAVSSDSDTNNWFTDGEELIRQAAKFRLAMDVLHAEDIAARAAAMRDDAYKGLLAENAKRMPQRVLYPPPILARSRFNIYRGW